MRSKTAAALVGTALLFAGAPALAKPAGRQFTGEITQLDAAAKTLVLKLHGGKTGTEMTFALAPDAKIVQGTKAKAVGELKTGERVRVTYVDQGSTHQAQRIEMLPPRTARARPSSPPAKKPESGY